MRNTLNNVSRLAALSLMGIALAGCATKPDPHRAQVDALAAPYIDSGHIVGMSVGFIVDGEHYTYHYGTTHAGEDNTPDDHTLYEIGSITKTFTGLMLARGTLEGAWQLDDPVSRYLPEGIALADDITLRRLSTHMSGLPRMPHDFAPTDATNPYADYDRDKLYATLGSITMESEPGTAASYSNLAVGLLGEAMALERGTTYDRLLAQWVLRPLGMRDTTISLSEREASRLAGPHNGAGEPDHQWDFQALAGAGAIRSDIVDMMHYAQAQLDPDSTPIAEAIKLSQQRHTDPDGPSLGNGMGLGWVFAGDPEDDGASITHAGQTGGFHCFIGINRARDYAIVVLTNTSNDYGSRFSSDLRSLLQGEDVQPAKLEPMPEVYPVEAATLERYVGRYELAPGAVFTVTTDGIHLYAQLTGQPTLRVYAVSDTAFEYRVVEARLEFTVEGEADATQLTLYQNGMVMPAKRIAPPRNDGRWLGCDRVDAVALPLLQETGGVESPIFAAESEAVVVVVVPGLDLGVGAGEGDVVEYDFSERLVLHWVERGLDGQEVDQVAQGLWLAKPHGDLGDFSLLLGIGGLEAELFPDAEDGRAGVEVRQVAHHAVVGA